MHELVFSDAGLVSIWEGDTTLFKEGRETALKLSWLIWEEVKESLDSHQYTNLHTCVYVPTKIARKTFVTQKRQSLRLHQRCCTNCEQACLKKTHQELRTGLWRVCSQGTNSSHNEDFSLCIAGRQSFGHQQPAATLYWPPQSTKTSLCHCHPAFLLCFQTIVKESIWYTATGFSKQDFNTSQ